MRSLKVFLSFLMMTSFAACNQNLKENKVVSKTAKELLGNPDYSAICFGGFRGKTRAVSPSVEELKEDMKVLAAMNIKLIRTYNTQIYPHAERVLQAIHELKQADKEFEMYVMLGAWIECEGAFTKVRNHTKENKKQNLAEIERAIELAKEYPEIVKIIAVGNESMVHWAETYFVQPKVILYRVEYLQSLKLEGLLGFDSKIWITSSDNFASWGGGSADYHNEDLAELIRAVDYVSMHTYPFHDTHYNPEFWQIDSTELGASSIELMTKAMREAKEYAISQYGATKEFVHKIAPKKPIHIGETGWSTSSKGFYGENGSKAAGEFQQRLYYDHMREWSTENKISCFFFEAFDEQWKDSTDPRGSENHFGLINLKSEVKYALWDLVDSSKFKGLIRNGNPITKTLNGNEEEVLNKVLRPAIKLNN